MDTTLLDYAKSINGVIKKADVLKTAEFTFNALKESVSPALQSILDNGELKGIKDSKELVHFASAVDLKHRSGTDVIARLKTFVDTVIRHEDDVYNLIKNDLCPNVTNKLFSLKDIAIVKLVDDLTGLSSFILDIAYIGMVDKSKTVFPKTKFTTVNENYTSFSTTYNIYSEDFGKYVKGIKTLSSEHVEINEGLGTMFAAFMSKASKGFRVPGMSGFNGNPIYHVRMWLVDRDVRKYEALKEKKQLIELKLLDLKNEQAKTHDPRLEKQIQYFEDKISSIEYDISKITDY